MRLLLPILCLYCTSSVADEILVKRVAIPNRLLKQGEAQLVEPASGPRFIRIALSTRHLAKVEQKIIEGETLNWPDSPDRILYLNHLNDLCTRAIASGKKPVVLTLEWHSDRVIFIYEGNVQPVEGLSPDYIQKNLLLITQDRFDLSEAEARILLQKDSTP